MHTSEFFFRNKEEMNCIFKDFPEAIENTVMIAEMCNLELDFSKTHLPPFTIDKDEKEDDPEAYFLRLCRDGCRERYDDFDKNQEALDRLEYEVGIIKKMGFVSYFLITWDFIRYAKEQGIPVGPGRGSAAGSIVAYALGLSLIHI